MNNGDVVLFDQEWTKEIGRHDHHAYLLWEVMFETHGVFIT